MEVSTLIQCLGITIAAAAGVTGAVSSLKNGRTLKDQNETGTVNLSLKPTLKKTSSDEKRKDWYEPPDLD